MKAFKSFWLGALENATTSAEDVWRGALEWVAFKCITVDDKQLPKVLSDIINKELNDE